jgi:hypothetical protein
MSAGDIGNHILLPMQIDSKELRERASECRMLAATALTDDGLRVLLQMADYYEDEADRADESPRGWTGKIPTERGA